MATIDMPVGCLRIPLLDRILARSIAPVFEHPGSSISTWEALRHMGFVRADLNMTPP